MQIDVVERVPAGIRVAALLLETLREPAADIELQRVVLAAAQISRDVRAVDRRIQLEEVHRVALSLQVIEERGAARRAEVARDARRAGIERIQIVNPRAARPLSSGVVRRI